MTHYFIKTQSDPSKPIGTIINVASGRAGMVAPRGSAYNISKVAIERFTETLQLGLSPPESLKHKKNIK